MEIISQKLITDPFDIIDAGIIDLHRLNGHWKTSGDALRTIFSWFDRKATLTVAHIPTFHDAPERNDWPGWVHVGNHSAYGKLYWNWFFWNHPGGELHFSDSPDFFGNFPKGESFWGDIGIVSASAFALTQKGMRLGDLWISVLDDGTRQVLIEPHYSILETYGEMIMSASSSANNTNQHEKLLSGIQLKLFT